MTELMLYDKNIYVVRGGIETTVPKLTFPISEHTVQSNIYIGI